MPFVYLLVVLLLGPAWATAVAASQPSPRTLADLLALPSGDDAFSKALRSGDAAQALACATQRDPARADGAFLLALGFALENQGRWVDAAASYEAAGAAEPALQDWARFGYARAIKRAAAEQPDPLVQAALEARSQWSYLALAPDFPRHQQALETVCSEGDGASALEACLAAARTRPNPDTLLAAARRHLAAGQLPEAQEALDSALLLRPSGFKGRAITALREAHFGKAPRTPGGTGMPILDRLFASHSYQRVVELATAELPALEKGSRRWCDLSLLAGRSLTRLSRESASLPWLSGILEECSALDSFDLDMALYLLADNAYKATQTPLCRRAVQRLRELHPGSRYCDDAMLILAKAELRAGNEPAAREAVAILVDHYPRGDMVPDALFLLQFDAWRRGDLARVQTLANHFGPRFDGDRDYRTQGRLRYWGARALETKKNAREAREAYSDLACRWPLSWYSLLALQRLESKKKGLASRTLDTCAARSPKLPQPEDLELNALPSQPALQRGLLLYRVGLTAWAAEEWGTLDAGATEAAALAKAALLEALGNHIASHDLLRRQAPSLMTSFPAGPNLLWWKLAYPRPHLVTLEKWAKAHGIPPELAFAITREESGFNPKARSHASALGLMQLLRKTARWVGREAGLRPSESDLFRPDINVRLGTRYLAMLYKDLGHLALAVSGYNCGGGCVKKLRKRHTTRELDEFVELIPYAETNRYTKRVLSSLAIYTWLYGKDLVKKLPPLKLP